LGFFIFRASFSSGAGNCCTAELPVVRTRRATGDAIALERAGRHGSRGTTAHGSGSAGAHTAADTSKDSTKFSFEPRFSGRAHDLRLRSLNSLRERRGPSGALAVDRDA
jgi:hypothetical protein